MKMVNAFEEYTSYRPICLLNTAGRCSNKSRLSNVVESAGNPTDKQFTWQFQQLIVTDKLVKAKKAITYYCTIVIYHARHKKRFQFV